MNVAELEAALKEAKKQQEKAGDDAWKDLAARAKGGFDWRVEWLDDYTIYVSLRYKLTFLNEMEALDKLYPSSYYRIFDDNRKWRGMAYLLIGNVLVQSGGGWMVLDIPRTTPFRSWHLLTQEQVDCLYMGLVPDDLKNDCFR